MIIAATGHRPNKLVRDDIKPFTASQHFMLVRLCEKHLRLMNATSCISGMALGFDQAFAHAAMNLGLPLIAAVPFVGQENIWPESSKKFWRHLIDYASTNGEVHYLEEHYSSKALKDRNCWMVDHCNILLALCNNMGTSGTAHCINYANLKMKKVVNIWDDFLTFERGN